MTLEVKSGTSEDQNPNSEISPKSGINATGDVDATETNTAPETSVASDIIGSLSAEEQAIIAKLREKQNNPNNSNPFIRFLRGAKEFLWSSLPRKIVTSVGTTALAAGSIVGVTVNHVEAAPQTFPSAASSPNPSPSSEVTPPSAAELEQERLRKLATADKDTAERLAALDIEDFNDRSLQDRLLRNNFYFYQIAHVDIPYEYFDQKLAGNVTLGDKNPIFHSTILSNGKDVMWFGAFAEQAVDTAGATSSKETANRDTNMASQLASGVVFNPKSNDGREFVRLKTVGKDVEKTGRIPDDQIPVFKSSTGIRNINIKGKNYNSRVITFEQSGKLYKETKVAIPSKLTVENPNTGEIETLEFANWLTLDPREDT